MKKVLGMLLIMSTMSMSLYAYDQTDRIKDMQAMEKAMAEIQTPLYQKGLNHPLFHQLLHKI